MDISGRLDIHHIHQDLLYTATHVNNQPQLLTLWLSNVKNSAMRLWEAVIFARR